MGSVNLKYNLSATLRKNPFFRFINGAEVVGNKLTHPLYLFCILCVIAITLSVIVSGVSISYMSASSSGCGGKMVTATVRSLLNRETVACVTGNMYKIYYNFAPMMMVGLLMLAIGLAGQVCFFSAFIRRTIFGCFLRVLLFVCDALFFLVYPIDFRALETAAMEQQNTPAISLR